jgi:hypothetical protein
MATKTQATLRAIWHGVHIVIVGWTIRDAIKCFIAAWTNNPTGPNMTAQLILLSIYFQFYFFYNFYKRNG